MFETPEQKARREIDRQLTAAGWLVQDKRHLNLHAGLPRALALFGRDRLPTLLEELNTALAA